MGERYESKRILGWMFLSIFIFIVAISISYVISKYLLDEIYESSSTLIVYDSNLDKVDRTITDPRTYWEIAISNQMMGEIAEQLDLHYGIKDIRAKIVTSYDQDIGLIYISVRDKDPEVAFRIVELLVNGLQSRVEELFGWNYLKVVDEPYFPYEASGPDVKLNMVIASILAILLSVLIILWDVKCR